MQITAIPEDIGLIKDESIKKALLGLWTKLARTINANIEFGSPQSQSKGLVGNINGAWPGTLAAGYTILTPGANVEFTVTHNLGRVPIGYDVKSKDRAGSVYDSRKSAWTTTQMFLKADTVGMNIVLFVH